MRGGVVFGHFKARNEIKHVVDDLHFRSLPHLAGGAGGLD